MKTGKQILDRVNTITGQGSDDDTSVQRNRSAVACGVTGLLFGLYYGYSKQHNMIITGLIGGGAGVLVSRMLVHE